MRRQGRDVGADEDSEGEPGGVGKVVHARKDETADHQQPGREQAAGGSGPGEAAVRTGVAQAPEGDLECDEPADAGRGAHRVVAERDQARGRRGDVDGSSSCTGRGSGNVAKYWMVKGVQSLHLKAEAQVLFNWELFEQG